MILVTKTSDQTLCVCVFIKLHITAQSGPVILVVLCHSHWFYQGRSVSTIAPPPNRLLYEGENEEYLPLQAVILKNKICDRLEFTTRFTQTGLTSKKKIKEKMRGIGFETVAGMGGGLS